MILKSDVPGTIPSFEIQNRSQTNISLQEMMQQIVDEVRQRRQAAEY